MNDFRTDTDSTDPFGVHRDPVNMMPVMVNDRMIMAENDRVEAIVIEETTGIVMTGLIMDHMMMVRTGTIMNQTEIVANRTTTECLTDATIHIMHLQEETIGIRNNEITIQAIIHTLHEITTLEIHLLTGMTHIFQLIL